MSGFGDLISESLDRPVFHAQYLNIVPGPFKVMASLFNGGTEIIEVTRIRAFGLANAAAVAGTSMAQVLFRSSANAAGVSAGIPVAYDSTDILPAGVVSTTDNTISITALLHFFTITNEEEGGPAAGLNGAQVFTYNGYEASTYFKKTPGQKGLILNPSQGIQVINLNGGGVLGLVHYAMEFSPVEPI